MTKKLLREYHKKRNFSKTPEPSAGKKPPKGKKLIFVVQEHHARRLHYDFRLEVGGVLKSWAVPKGPSPDPADKRLAVETEDHPLDYAKFHGTIPQGEYGAGEVFIWDSGSWESLEDDPVLALKKGHLKFNLSGKKLKGTYVLVRTQLGAAEGKKNWLLIKEHKEKKKPNSRQADPWPDFVHPQLSKLVSDISNQDRDWIYEIKFDGYRIQGQLKNHIGHFFTRTGRDWSRSFPHLLQALEKLPLKNAIFDGEIVALDEEGRSHFQKLQNSIKSKHDQQLRYYIFDLLYLNGEDLRQWPLLQRKALLKKILKNCAPEIIYSEHFQEQGKTFLDLCCQRGLEGIVAKRSDSPYTSKRNGLWLKVKCKQRQEFVIGGWTETEEGRQGFGALLLGVYHKDKLKYVGKVGTGFNHQSVKNIKKELQALETKVSPFALGSPQSKNIHWVKPLKVAEVTFGNWTEEGLLRTAVFLGLREDKPAKYIHLEKIHPHKLSSPDKIIFKKEKITKKEIADFYLAISKEMLPYLVNRPLSLFRCPHGPESTCFFQKHLAGNIPKSFKEILIEESHGKERYPTINSAAGLSDLVQLNAFEIHSWNCHSKDVTHPDQFVMDLDPGPGVTWSQVIRTAFEIKENLEDLNLKSFVKLTGSKGLHIHVPIAPIYSWDQVKLFTQAMALEMASRRPELYLATSSKKSRKNRIFIDYLRNSRGATSVVPYSLRAKPTSAVALPVEWEELRKIKASNQFTMVKALKKIKARHADPWEGFLKLKQKISILKRGRIAA